MVRVTCEELSPANGAAASIFQTLLAGTVQVGLVYELVPDEVPEWLTTWLNCKFP